MGYHVITLTADNKLSRHYIDDLKSLYKLTDIDENSIIYQGEKSWVAELIKENEVYKQYIDPNRSNGYRAEKAFEEFISTQKGIWEKLSQDKESFAKYYQCSPDKPVKRPDYRIFNFNQQGDIDIEVKARSFNSDSRNRLSFTFNYYEFSKLQNLQNIMQTPIILVVYKITDNGIDESNQYFISLDEIGHLNKERLIDYKEAGKYFRIPIEFCQCGIEGLQGIVDRMLQSKKVNCEYKKAFEQESNVEK